MTLCCRSLPRDARSVPSPFVRLVAVGYYDGPTHGLVECGGCGRLYAFCKLDWDDGQDVRIFSLAPTQGRGDLFCGESGSTILLLVDEEGRLASERVGEAMDAASGVEFVVAAQDLLGVLEAWRATPSCEGVDWFAEFGLGREAEP